MLVRIINTKRMMSGTMEAQVGMEINHRKDRKYGAIKYITKVNAKSIWYEAIYHGTEVMNWSATESKWTNDTDGLPSITTAEARKFGWKVGR